MHKLDLEAARGTSGRLFPSVCLLLKADERWGQTAWIQGPNPSRLCAHTHTMMDQLACNLHCTPQDKDLKLWACIIRQVNYCFLKPKARELAAEKLWAVAASKMELVLASSVSTIKSLPACMHWSCFFKQKYGQFWFQLWGVMRKWDQKESLYSPSLISCQKAITSQLIFQRLLQLVQTGSTQCSISCVMIRISCKSKN